MTGEDANAFTGLLEASLYHSAAESEAVERFYAEQLALPLVARWPGGRAFRVGKSVLLLFEREGLAERDTPIAAHGTVGPGHACLLLGEPAAYDIWRSRLAAAAIAITHEHEWEDGHRSLYFADPAGNLLEIADGDLWPGGRDG